MAISKRLMKATPSNSRKIIDGVVHVWDIFENRWMPETEWDEMQRHLKKLVR